MTRNAGPAQDLGPRQERFVDEYLIDLNAKQAAIRAGYSPKTAEVQGSRLLSNVKVQRALSKAIDRRAAKVEIDQEWVLSRLALVIERCLQSEPVRDRKGTPVVIATPQGQLASTVLSSVAQGIRRSADTVTSQGLAQSATHRHRLESSRSHPGKRKHR